MKHSYNLIILLFCMFYGNSYAQNTTFDQIRSTVKESNVTVNQKKTESLLQTVIDSVDIAESRTLFQKISSCSKARRSFNKHYYRAILTNAEIAVLAGNDFSAKDKIIAATWLAIIFPSHIDNANVIPKSALETVRTYSYVFATCSFDCSLNDIEVVYDAGFGLPQENDPQPKTISSMTIGIDAINQVKNDLNEAMEDILQFYNCE